MGWEGGVGGYVKEYGYISIEKSREKKSIEDVSEKVKEEKFVSEDNNVKEEVRGGKGEYTAVVAS